MGLSNPFNDFIKYKTCISYKPNSQIDQKVLSKCTSTSVYKNGMFISSYWRAFGNHVLENEVQIKVALARAHIPDNLTKDAPLP